MKLIRPILALLTILLSMQAQAQITCTPGGNLWVYANYDGGVLNINVDQNIPNIKIGICTYEPTTINLSGAFVGNVTEVRYAGYVSTTNFHCNNSPSTTTINGVPSNITSVNFLPPSTLSNPNGYSSIVCAYSCSTTSNQGGCNTADQIKAYFQTSMNATMVSYFTQYGCWSTSPYLLSTGGNCCSSVTNCLLTASAGPDQQTCPGGTVQLSGSATGGATTYSWAPTTGLSNPNSATTNASPTSTTTYILTASDGGVCVDMDTVTVTVLTPQVSLDPLPVICNNAAPFALTNGNPSGGTYTGVGVSAGMLDPSVAGPGNHALYYSAVDSNGCTGTASGSFTVVAPAAVTIDFFDPFCINDPAATPILVGPQGGVFAGPGIINGQFHPAVAGAGTHTVTYAVTDGNGCSSSGSTSVVVNPLPQAPTISFTAPNLSTLSTGDSIQWFLNGNYLLTGGSSIVPTQNGVYTAILWVGGCPSPLSNGVTVELVGVEGAIGQLVVGAFPNPSKDWLWVTATGASTMEAAVYDVSGRRITPTVTGTDRVLIDTRPLAAGCYLLRVAADGGQTTLRVLHIPGDN